MSNESGRSYTTEQKAAVLRVRKCDPTAFYEILELESVRTTCSESEIKKSYRKLSLLTHPDKNGYDGADEAFKLVSKAFQILSDPEKKERYDKFGGDPDSRHSAPTSSPFSGFARSPGSSMYDDGPEISPEELFRQFFGGGMGGPMGGGFPGFAFETGPQFVFNMGGPGGIRVTQFGGPNPRRRPRDPNAPPQAAPQPDLWQMFIQFLPIILFFLLPLFGSFLNSGANGPSFSLHSSQSPYTKQVKTANYKIPYFVNPSDYNDLSRTQRQHLESRVIASTVSELSFKCQEERTEQNRQIQDAQGWFSTDEAKEAKARNMKLKSCERLVELKNMGA